MLRRMHRKDQKYWSFPAPIPADILSNGGKVAESTDWMLAKWILGARNLLHRLRDDAATRRAEINRDSGIVDECLQRDGYLRRS
jgi:hypothetical protein